MFADAEFLCKKFNKCTFCNFRTTISRIIKFLAIFGTSVSDAVSCRLGSQLEMTLLAIISVIIFFSFFLTCFFPMCSNQKNLFD